MNDSAPGLDLRYGLKFPDLHHRDGLSRLDAAFLAHVAEIAPDLAESLARARMDCAEMSGGEESALLVALAPLLEDFLAELFRIAGPLADLKARQDALAPLSLAKRLFVQRRAAKEIRAEDAAKLDSAALVTEYEALVGAPFDELDFSRRVLAWMDDEEAHGEELALALRLSAARIAGHGAHGRSASVLFNLPAKRDPLSLVPAHHAKTGGIEALEGDESVLRERDGFGLTDQGADMAEALDQINYCIFCHHQGRDSCSRGLVNHKTGEVKINAIGTEMAGCPLEEKISEMHEVRAAGQILAALAMIVVDNPMVAGTGHRICNDCMVACIYQNQNRDPVDIPKAESRILLDVLELPWGFEIYSLLTRWNPLNLARPLPKPPSGRKVLVVGMGPAGYTLAHHLMQDGHAVVAVDGLKIEPLPPAISGIDMAGRRNAFEPIRDIGALWRPLGERVLAGFGGVAEYGITVRWNKNLLTVLRLLVERREEFRMFGGVRFGGNITLEQAFEMGFDHVALAMGAGKPTILDIPNNLAPGVRQASDFLMALQLTGAAKSDSLANLQLRMPVVVIGGGLTAIDTCTEALAYYPVQVEKFLHRFEALAAEAGPESVMAIWNGEDRQVAEEFLAHGRAIRAERARAHAAGEEPRIRDLLRQWGGATIAYRRSLTDSPAYRNHEEVAKAMEEGIRFAEGLTPVAVEVDAFDSASGLRVRNRDGEELTLAARSILVAAGTRPNTVMAREFGGIHLDGKYFQAVDESGNPRQPEAKPKPAETLVLMRVDDHDRRVSFFGDLHPSFAGNVVSAMASAKRGYPVITRAMERHPASAVSWAGLTSRLDRELGATVEAVHRLTPAIVEVVVRAPAASANFRPGQFFRLQNYEAFATRAHDTVLAMEGIALTGAWTDPDKGLVGLVVLEMGGSSNLCADLKAGEPVVLMGPTGTPTTIRGGETVLLAGGGLGNAVLFSIGAAFRAAGSRVLYFAGYKKHADRYKVADIEAAADQVIWCVDQGPPLEAGRPQDRSFVGNIVEAMIAYGEGRLGEPRIPMQEVDRLIAIGSDAMMGAIATERHRRLEPFLDPAHVGIGSINSPMQCMMKEICAQCIQRHVDPETGEVSVVFSCFEQDQPLDRVDFKCLADRLGQNSASERLTAAWIRRNLKAARGEGVRQSA